MLKLDMEIGSTVKKITGGKDIKVLDYLGSLFDILDNPEAISEEKDLITKLYGKTALSQPEEYVAALKFRLRQELARKHNILETFRIYEALKFLDCRLIRVSKTSPNYDNVRIARKLSNLESGLVDFPFFLFDVLEMIDKVYVK